MKLTAFYLAQEGIEIVRNLRDNNWLNQTDNPTVTWKAGISNGEWEAGYSDSGLSPFMSPGRYLYLDGNTGFYTYLEAPSSSDIQTKFKRKIVVTEVEDDILDVKILVDWQERGRSHSIEVVERLYNWYGR